jgi:hypothetical protein
MGAAIESRGDFDGGASRRLAKLSRDGGSRPPAPSRRCAHRLPGDGWARRGTRPSAPQDQRTKWADVFGAIRPAESGAAGLAMP